MEKYIMRMEIWCMNESFQNEERNDMEKCIMRMEIWCMNDTWKIMSLKGEGAFIMIMKIIEFVIVEIINIENFIDYERYMMRLVV